MVYLQLKEDNSSRRVASAPWVTNASIEVYCVHGGEANEKEKMDQAREKQLKSMEGSKEVQASLRRASANHSPFRRKKDEFEKEEVVEEKRCFAVLRVFCSGRHSTREL